MRGERGQEIKCAGGRERGEKERLGKRGQKAEAPKGEERERVWVCERSEKEIAERERIRV